MKLDHNSRETLKITLLKQNLMKRPAKTFTDLIVWQKAHRFVLNVYKFTANFPKSELYALTSQFRRASVSIPANVSC